MDALSARNLWVWTLLYDTIVGRFPIPSNTTLHTMLIHSLSTTPSPSIVPMPSNATVHSVILTISAEIHRLVAYAV